MKAPLISGFTINVYRNNFRLVVKSERCSSNCYLFRNKATAIVKGLMSLITEANLGELTSLEELVRILL